MKKLFYPDGKLPKDKNSADAIIEWSNKSTWVVDFKFLKGNGNNISTNLKKAYKQADYAIIKIQEDIIDKDKIIRDVKSFMRTHKRFKGVVVYDNKSKIVYSK